MQFYLPIPLPQSLPQVLHKIRNPKEDSPQTYMDDMVSPWWTVSILFRINCTRHSTQDPSPSPTLHILCVWRFYQPKHSSIFPGIIEIKNSGIYSPQWSTNTFSSNDRDHHKFQNSHLQPTHRQYSSEVTQQKQPQSKTHYETAFSGPSITSYPFTGPFAIPFLRPWTAHSPFSEP